MTDNSILLSFYNDAFSTIHCQVSKGVLNKAKPIVLMAMINLVEKGITAKNKFLLTEIKEDYECLQKQYNVTTPYQYSVYFLESESFYHLKWKTGRIKTHTPSGKLIRENVEYAYLDNALWDLLQEQEMRDHFRSIIENHYLK